MEANRWRDHPQKTFDRLSKGNTTPEVVSLFRSLYFNPTEEHSLDSTIRCQSDDVYCANFRLLRISRRINQDLPAVAISFISLPRQQKATAFGRG
jgi:hypothetical protein